MGKALVLVVMLAAICTGCVLPQSVEVSGSGATAGVTSQRLSCGSSASLDRYLAGAGAVSITVADGTLAPAYNGPTDVEGEVDDTLDLAGAPGTWKLAVDAEGFAGQFEITLSCP